MKTKRIAIRTDGNAQIGTGHLMRCMTIANALKEMQVEVFFVINNEQSEIFLGERGFSYHMIQGHYESMEEETLELLQILKEQDVQLLIVDSYNATEEYLAEINAQIPVFYLDDFGASNLSVSGLINYNVYAQKAFYKKHYPKEVELILGSKYAPVKPEFSATPYEIRDKVKRILITMGGSDMQNVAGSLGEELIRELPEDIELTLICGKFNPHLEELTDFSKANPRVQVLINVPDMWNQIAKSDLVIAATGTTMYELCTIGVPTICCHYVDNQRKMAEYFGKETSMVNAGDYSKAPKEVLSSIVEETKRLILDAELRQKLSMEMKAISDGKGAHRIAEKLCNYLETK